MRVFWVNCCRWSSKHFTTFLVLYCSAPNGPRCNNIKTIMYVTYILCFLKIVLFKHLHISNILSFIFFRQREISKNANKLLSYCNQLLYSSSKMSIFKKSNKHKSIPQELTNEIWTSFKIVYDIITKAKKTQGMNLATSWTDTKVCLHNSVCTFNIRLQSKH